MLTKLSTIDGLKKFWVIIIWKFTDSNGSVDSRPNVVTKRRAKLHKYKP